MRRPPTVNDPTAKVRGPNDEGKERKRTAKKMGRPKVMRTFNSPNPLILL